jgi:hypothetical protein
MKLKLLLMAAATVLATAALPAMAADQKTDVMLTSDEIASITFTPEEIASFQPTAAELALIEANAHAATAGNPQGYAAARQAGIDALVAKKRQALLQQKEAGLLAKKKLALEDISGSTVAPAEGPAGPDGIGDFASGEAFENPNQISGNKPR